MNTCTVDRCINCHAGRHEICGRIETFETHDMQIHYYPCKCPHLTVCEACKDTGWLHSVKSETGLREIQRCDSCYMIVDDDAAYRIHAATCKCNWQTSNTMEGC